MNKYSFGAAYERQVLSCMWSAIWDIDGSPVSTQSDYDIGCITGGADIILKYKGERINVEVKSCIKYFSSCDIKYNNGRWDISLTSCGFNPLLVNAMEVCPWNKKAEGMRYPTIHELGDPQALKMWNAGHRMKKDFISKLCRAKGCSYIQIKGHGLYHLGYDVCNFGVPYFKIKQKAFFEMTDSLGRYQPKVKPRAKGVPLVKSPFSLDELDTLPRNMVVWGEPATKVQRT